MLRHPRRTLQRGVFLLRHPRRGQALLSEHVAAAPFFAVLQSGRSTWTRDRQPSAAKNAARAVGASPSPGPLPTFTLSH